MIATAGFLVLLLLYLDVFLTVFHPEGHGGPLTGRLNRTAWGGFRALAGARPAKALAFAGPMMPVLTLLVWMGLLIAGYALIYYPRFPFAGHAWRPRARSRLLQRRTCATRRMSSSGWRVPALGGSSTGRGRPGTALIVGVALLAAAPAAAQGPSASPVPSGAGYGMGLVLTRPLLDARTREPFEQVGRFRAGPGMALWLRFDGVALGASATAEAAGLDIGPEIVRDGISMGRQAAVYAAFAALAHWRPARARAVGWRPEVFAGPVLTSLGEVAVRMDQLPPYARDSAAGAEDTTALATGIRGRGVRLGVALERTWAGSGLWDNVSIRAELGADRIWIGEMEHGGRRVRLPRHGTATFPRLVVGLTWRPSPGRPPSQVVERGAAVGAPKWGSGWEQLPTPGSHDINSRSGRPAPGAPPN